MSNTFKTIKTVGDLKKALAEYPDDMPVGLEMSVFACTGHEPDSPCYCGDEPKHESIERMCVDTNDEFGKPLKNKRLTIHG